MSIEPLYQNETREVEHGNGPSPAIGVLNVLLTIVWWGGWAFLALFSCIVLYTLLAFVGVEAVQKSIDMTTPAMALVSAASMLIVSAVFLVIVKQLRLICNTLLTGDPFVPENAGRLRTIWIAVALGELLRLGSTFFISWVNKSTGGATIEETDIRIYTWFLVLALIILAEVFREGTRLRQEAKLTV